MKDIQAPFPSFIGYINKVFDFRAWLKGLADARTDPAFSAAAVFQAVFYGFLFQLRSFHQLEAELEAGFLQHWIGVKQPFREKTLRYSYSSFETERLEEMLVGTNRQLKRNKVFNEGMLAGRIVAAIDGVEVLNSYSRCCEFCLRRKVWEKTKEGEMVERLQYYHRLVGCQIVSGPVKPILGIEWQLAGEDEVAATKRLMRKIERQYGNRFFDVLLLDSLYAQAPVLRLADEIGWDLVVVLKQEARDLYKDAQGLFNTRPPDLCLCQSTAGQTVEARIWEQDGLPFTKDYPKLVRVLRSDETVTETRVEGGKRKRVTTRHHWVWLSTLEGGIVKAKVLWQMGHLRWKNENNGWNDLTQNWMLKHGFLHACKHRVKVNKPEDDQNAGEQYVPNRGLAPVVLTLCIAFVLFTAFTLRHSKFFRAHKTTYREIAQKLYRSMLQNLPLIRAPAG
jgi:hypothetical protein